MEKIVVGFDASEQARDALRLAEALRAAGDGELIVAAIDEVEPYFGDFVHWRQLREEYYASMFDAAAEQLGRSDFTRRTSAGSVPAALESIAGANGADVIVVGSTHRGRFGRALPGSVGDRLLSGAPCAVAIAPRGYQGREHPPVRLIGVGFDGRDESQAALSAAVELAREFDADLRLISVAPSLVELVPGRISDTQPGYARAMRAHFAERLAEGAKSVRAGIEVDAALIEGDPASELANQGVELDLLVLGSRGYGPVRRVLLGGVARSVVGLAPCPVVVIPRSAKVQESGLDDRDAEAASL